MIVIFKYIKCCCKRQVNNLSFTSTVDSTESNDLFNSGETLKENNCNCKDNQILEETAKGGCGNSIITKAFKEQGGQMVIWKNKGLVDLWKAKGD